MVISYGSYYLAHSFVGSCWHAGRCCSISLQPKVPLISETMFQQGGWCRCPAGSKLEAAQPVDIETLLELAPGVATHFRVLDPAAAGLGVARSGIV